jgi:hypothetical protein
MEGMTPQEWGAIGGRTRAKNLTKAERKAASSQAHLASCVAQVVAKAPELTDAQRARLRAIFVPAFGEAVQK